jgi:VCBS repeat-containing protein
MSLNQNSLLQETITADDIYVRALLNDGWRWNPPAPAAATVIRWAVDPTWTPLQVQTVTDMFAEWAAVTNFTFQQVTNPDDAEIVLHQTVSSNIGGFGGYSGTTSEATAAETYDDVTIAQNGQVHTYLATDGWLISGQNTFIPNPDATTVGANPTIISAAGFELLLHEVGHALGLKHPHDGGAVSSADMFPGVTSSASTGNNGLNESRYTLMSYNHWDSDGTVDADTPTMATPMAFDIAAIQRLYGANTTIQDGNDTYVLSEPGDLTLECIWDSGGTDEIVYNGLANAFIDLRPATLDDSATGGGVLSYTGTVGGNFGYGFTIAGDYTNALVDENGVTGVIIENATGGFGNDEFTGNDVDNSWCGNAGNDKSDGAGGVDIAVFSGVRADYQTSLVGGWVEIADLRAGNPDGTNSLLNFEFFEFSNGVYTLDEVLNQPPVAAADSNGAAKNSTLTVNAAAGVLANDLDDYNDVFVSAIAGGTVGQVVQGTYGALTLNADGSYVYVANKGALPSKIVAQDVFTYTVSDDVGGSDTATLSIVVSNPGVTYSSGENTTLSGGNRPDVLDGSAGNVVQTGGNGADVLIGGDGNTLTGGHGPDTFLFRPEFGVNLVTDFNVKTDAIQFDASIFATSADLFANTSDSGAGAIVHDGSGNTVTLSGVTLAQMQAHANSFYFV